MRVLVTGASGFVGSHLVDYLLELEGVQVYALGRRGKASERGAGAKSVQHFYSCDLLDASGVKRILEETRPDGIFHLAGQAFVPYSWDHPEETLSVNILGELHLFEALRQLNISPRIHIAGSSEEYGLVYPKEVPLGESAPLRPMSPYGVSKVAQSFLGYQYYKSFGMPILRTRAFSQTGPRQKEEFVASNFAKQIAMAEANQTEAILHVGDLGAVRDFMDVRDVAKAYWLVMEKGEPGEVYNICTGVGRSIQEIVDILLGQSRVKICVQKDPARMRPSDLPLLVGDGTKFKRQTGWEPKIPFEKTLRDLLNHWRAQVASRVVAEKN